LKWRERRMGGAFLKGEAWVWACRWLSLLCELGVSLCWALYRWQRGRLSYPPVGWSTVAWLLRKHICARSVCKV
jgi:hypothetical protein